jgi:hypothetical protein
MIVCRVSAFVLSALFLPGVSVHLANARQPTQPSLPMAPGEAVQGVVHREGDERYKLAFGSSGMAVAEVSGLPGDCAVQIGTQGFQESETAPVDWTDGQPGQAVRHTFRVHAGRPGTIWVLLRSRVSGVSAGQWSGVACSASGPFYTTPNRGASSSAGPGAFEGRPVRPPIAFRLVASVGGSPPAASATGSASMASASPAASKTLRDDGLGFSLEYPQDWSLASAEPGTRALSGPVGAAAGEARVTVSVLPKSTVPGGSASQLLLKTHERLTDSGAELSTMGPVPMAGLPALSASHTYEGRDAQGRAVPFDHVLLVLDRGPSIYVLTFVAPHESFVRLTPALKRMCASWRFLTQ